MFTWCRNIPSITLVFGLLIFNSHTAFASNNEVTLQWAPNTEEDLSGYNVYHGTQSGVYGFPVNVGNTTTHHVSNLDPSKPHYFSVTAYDQAGNESQPSSEVMKTFSSTTHHLEASIVGNGTVSSTPSGLSCTTTTSPCSLDFPEGSSITLTVTPGTHSTFSHWSGACSGSGTCSVNMTQARSVTATFVSSSSVHNTITHVNFQRTGSTIPPGFVKDDGARYSSSRGYGWDREVSTRERNAHSDQTLDTFIHFASGTSATWTYDLPNGDYLVSLASGDPSWAQGPHHVTVENQTLINNVSTQRNEFLTITDVPVTVNDGQLTLVLTREDGKNTILNYLTIAALEDPNQPPQTHTLSTTIIGKGTIKSSPQGISCSEGECSTKFSSDAQVTLTATPQDGWEFTGWGGACVGTGSCILTLSENTNVSATFALKTPESYTLSVSKTGNGTITSVPSGLNCTKSENCQITFTAQTIVTLNHSADSGYSFSHWDGPCTGTSSCTITMTKDQTVKAIFVSEPSSPPAKTININFQPSGSSIPAGYLKDDGARYSSSRGYGWSQKVSTRERNVHSDQTLDTFIHFAGGTTATWNYDLPNGSYLISLASGDPSWAQGPHHITVEGHTLINNVSTQRNEFLTFTDVPVTVTDGNLTVTLKRQDRKNTILNMIRIKPDTQGTDTQSTSESNQESGEKTANPIKVNFQRSGSHVPAGYQKDDGSRYSSKRGFGWDQSVSTRERNAHSDQTLDTFIHFAGSSTATWNYDLPNGSYLISFASGDPSWAQGPHHITVEGQTLIDNVSTQKNEFLTITDVPIIVTDGNLTVILKRGGKKNTILNYIEIIPVQ